MFLNYEAFAHPKGECFRFPAKDDDDARRIMEDYLKSSKQFRASIYRWKPEDDTDCNMYDHKNEIEVEIPELPRQQSVEYKIETRYIKYIKCTGETGEEAFFKAAKTVADTCDTLPEHPGWEKRYRADLAHFTDDERYGALPEAHYI